jgi:hypothetical protein
VQGAGQVRGRGQVSRVPDAVGQPAHQPAARTGPAIFKHGSNVEIFQFRKGLNYRYDFKRLRQGGRQ